MMALHANGSTSGKTKSPMHPTLYIYNIIIYINTYNIIYANLDLTQHQRDNMNCLTGLSSLVAGHLLVVPQELITWRCQANLCRICSIRGLPLAMRGLGLGFEGI